MCLSGARPARWNCWGGETPAAGEGDGMTMPADDLEGRYRRLVGLFPPAYRVARGEEMVSALMDGAVPGQQRPRRGEQWDLRLAAARQWTRSALLPPADAMPATVAVLAWLLPSVLLYPAAKAV